MVSFSNVSTVTTSDEDVIVKPKTAEQKPAKKSAEQKELKEAVVDDKSNDGLKEAVLDDKKSDDKLTEAVEEPKKAE